ncbi:porin [Leeia aquatica]|uniref:Porin n=1 Tax=Leeia aquatica TaxID=2725557 RepID=A0A847SJN7_9NEIS|nr:porin [Leeia aquatica]NLR76122.1 porin [Leeia aquatica]
MKKLIAVAVLGALAAPAFADSGNVTISGYVRGGLQILNSDANYARQSEIKGESKVVAGDKTRQTQIDGRGQIQFNMSEDLGNGLTAVGQIRSRFSLDGSNYDEGDTKRDGTFGNHNTWVGLKGSFGQVRLGRGEDNFGDGKYDALELYGDVLHGRKSGTGNMVRYDLPAMGGFTGSLQWSTKENKSTTERAETGTSLRVDYDASNWGVGFAYDRQNHAYDDTAAKYYNVNTWEITGGVKFGDWTIGAEYQQWKKSTATPKQKAFTLYAGASFGKVDFQIQAGRERNVGFNSDVKATTWSVGMNYNLSKRSKFFAEAVSYKQRSSTSTTKPSRFFVGMKHSF